MLVSYLVKYDLDGSPQIFRSFIMWYSNILIELFQVEIASSQWDHKFLNNFVKALNHKCSKFTNQYAFSFRFTNLLVCLILFRSPSWPCGSSCRGGGTKKDVDEFSYLLFESFFKILFFILEIISDKSVSWIFSISTNQ